MQTSTPQSFFMPRPRRKAHRWSHYGPRSWHFLNVYSPLEVEETSEVTLLWPVGQTLPSSPPLSSPAGKALNSHNLITPHHILPRFLLAWSFHPGSPMESLGEISGTVLSSLYPDTLPQSPWATGIATLSFSTP